MEKLSAFDLIILIIDVAFAAQGKNSERFTYVHQHLEKRLHDELKSREIEEIEAAMNDLKHIDPELSKEVDRCLFILGIVAKIKRQQ